MFWPRAPRASGLLRRTLPLLHLLALATFALATACACYCLCLLLFAPVASVATQRSCNAPGRCNCCFSGHATLLQRSWTLQRCFWGHVALLQRSLGPRNALATLLVLRLPLLEPHGAPVTALGAAFRQVRPRNDPNAYGCCNCCR